MSEDRSIGEQPEWVRLVRAQVETLRFGTVQLTIHEGQVVQVEKIERVRLAPGVQPGAPARPAGGR